MRIGMNLLLWTTHVGPEHFQLLHTLAAKGFNGVEIPIFGGTETEFKAVGSELKRAGLGCSTITTCTPGASPVSPDAAERARAVERLKWVLDMSAIVGADLLSGPYVCPLGQFTGVAPTDEEKKRAADVLRAGAEHAATLKLRIAVEFLCRFETYMLNTVADACELARRVDHPSVGILYDTFHANIEEKDPPAALAAAGDYVIHFHVSENDRGTPGSGHVQWSETFKTLRKMKYEGWLTIESFSRVLPELAAATRVWRDLSPSAEDVYDGGVRFIKRMWDQAG